MAQKVKILTELEAEAARLASSNDDVAEWEARCASSLRGLYGEDSREFTDFGRIGYEGPRSADGYDVDEGRTRAVGLRRAQALLAAWRRVALDFAHTDISARRKQDKFGILDSPSHFTEDFRSSIGKFGVSVIFFDLDRFGQLNKQFSEPVIDRSLLQDLHKLIAEIADKRGFAYAEGGDEFVVILPNTNVAQAAVFAEALLDTIRSAEFRVNEKSIRVTASAGIASAMATDAAQACREAAAKAKQKAKDDGRNRYAVADAIVASSENIPVAAR